MKDTKIQWHPAFISAMSLELKGYLDSLTFQKEYNLNTKPLEIDLLIIKKEPSTQISGEIGKFFKGHNVLEYKSPDDVTISIVQDTKPAGLFKYLEGHGHEITARHNGIYGIEGITAWFPTQVIVTGELDSRLHTWLRALSPKLDKEDLQKLLDDVSKMTEKFDREMASSVLEVSIRANREAADELKGEGPMFEVLMEIMEPKIEEIRKEELEKGLEKGLSRGIHGNIEMLRKLNFQDAEIKEMIIEQYKLSEEEATRYLKH